MNNETNKNNYITDDTETISTDTSTDIESTMEYVNNNKTDYTPLVILFIIICTISIINKFFSTL